MSRKHITVSGRGGKIDFIITWALMLSIVSILYSVGDFDSEVLKLGDFTGENSVEPQQTSLQGLKLEQLQTQTQLNKKSKEKEQRLVLVEVLKKQVVSRGGLRKPTINYFDLRQPSHVSVKQMESFLKSDLKGYGKAFVEAEKEYGINALFLAGLARLESSNGESRISKTKNNIFGFGVFDSNTANGHNFESIEECVNTVARYLSEEYLTEGGKHFSGYGILDVNKKYSTSTEWDNKIIELIEIELERMGD